MSKFFAVLFVALTGRSFWFSAFVYLLVIAITAWLVAFAIRCFKEDTFFESLCIIIMMLSGAGALLCLIIGILKVIF